MRFFIFLMLGVCGSASASDALSMKETLRWEKGRVACYQKTPFLNAEKMKSCLERSSPTGSINIPELVEGEHEKYCTTKGYCSFGEAAYRYYLMMESMVESQLTPVSSDDKRIQRQKEQAEVFEALKILHHSRDITCNASWGESCEQSDDLKIPSGTQFCRLFQVVEAEGSSGQLDFVKAPYDEDHDVRMKDVRVTGYTITASTRGSGGSADMNFQNIHVTDVFYAVAPIDLNSKQRRLLRCETYKAK